MKGVPIYLRDLKQEIQDQLLVETIMKDPVLQWAFKAEEDIIVGYYIEKPKMA